jgi:hypothetical protein
MPKRQLDALEHLQLCSVCDPAKEILTSKFSYLCLLFLLFGMNEIMKEFRIHCKQKETTGTAHHPVIYFFRNPTEQTKTGSANGLETTHSKPPIPIIMIDQSETLGAAVRLELVHSSLAEVLGFAAGPFASLRKLCNLSAKVLGQNHFAEPNRRALAFLHPILVCRVTC